MLIYNKCVFFPFFKKNGNITAHSSVVEHLPFKQLVKGSIPFAHSCGWRNWLAYLVWDQKVVSSSLTPQRYNNTFQ
jgi:hypothetical protein